jgi:hypothetical protein
MTSTGGGKYGWMRNTTEGFDRYAIAAAVTTPALAALESAYLFDKNGAKGGIEFSTRIMKSRVGRNFARFN